MYVGLQEQWWETRLLTFSGGWVLLGGREPSGWRRTGRSFLAGLILSAPVWWHALRNPKALPTPARRRSTADGASGWVGRGEALYFFTTPILLGWATYGLAPDRFEATPGLLPLLSRFPYLLAGYLRPRPPFALVGAAAVAVAAAGAVGRGPARSGRCSGSRLLWPALDHQLDRTDGRWYGVLTWAAAAQVPVRRCARAAHRRGRRVRRDRGRWRSGA